MSETTEDRAMRSVKPWHFRWPWVTFEGHFGDLLTLVTLCVQLTRNLLAIAKFLVFIIETVTKSGNCMFMTVEESQNPRHKPMGYNPPFCRVMLLSSCVVCVTFVYSVKTNEHIFIHFSLSGSHTILVFPTKRYAGGIGRNGDSEPISGFTAWRYRPGVINTSYTTPPDRGPV